jgi:hypothetical protein
MCTDRCARLLTLFALPIGLLAGPGCLSFLNPVGKPAAELVEACHACPQPCRNHVHVFVMNGLDPTNCCNLTGLCDCLRSLGYLKTYYGCPGHYWCFASEIRRIHKEDADARFVLVGNGVGGNLVDSIAWGARKDCIPIDLIVYLDCNTVGAERPDNAARVLNVWSDGNVTRAADLNDAENIHLANAWPWTAPSSRITIETLADELAQVAARVPVAVPEEPAPAVPMETAPTPRPVMPQVSEKRDDWDFLKPVNRFGDWPVLTGRRKGGATPPPTKIPDGEKVTSN